MPKLRNSLVVAISEYYARFDQNKHNLPMGRKRFTQICSLAISPRITHTSDHSIAGQRVRYYRQRRSTERRPTVLYLHGGGYVLGGIQSHDILCRRIAKYCDTDVLSINYSLAPERQFPAQLNEIRRVIDSVFEKRPAYMGKGPLFIGGDSAGGNIAASMASEYPHEFSGLILFYPMLDLSHEHPSVKANGVRENFLTRDMIRWFIDQYIPRKQDRDKPEASPLFTPTERLIPTFLAIGELDPFLDEARQYIAMLVAANVTHKLIVPKHTIHGFMQFPRLYGYYPVLAQAKKFIQKAVAEQPAK